MIVDFHLYTNIHIVLYTCEGFLRGNTLDVYFYFLQLCLRRNDFKRSGYSTPDSPLKQKKLVLYDV